MLGKKSLQLGWQLGSKHGHVILMSKECFAWFVENYQLTRLMFLSLAAWPYMWWKGHGDVQKPVEDRQQSLFIAKIILFFVILYNSQQYLQHAPCFFSDKSPKPRYERNPFQLLKLRISVRKARPYVRCWWLWKQLSTGPLKHVRWQRRCRAWWFDVVLGPKAGSSNFSPPRRNEASMKRQPILWALPKVKNASCSCRGSVWRRRLFRGKIVGWDDGLWFFKTGINFNKRIPMNSWGVAWRLCNSKDSSSLPGWIQA